MMLTWLMIWLGLCTILWRFAVRFAEEWLYYGGALYQCTAPLRQTCVFLSKLYNPAKRCSTSLTHALIHHTAHAANAPIATLLSFSILIRSAILLMKAT